MSRADKLKLRAGIVDGPISAADGTVSQNRFNADGDSDSDWSGDL